MQTILQKALKIVVLLAEERLLNFIETWNLSVRESFEII